ncbi:MAG: hypothetical protein ACRDSH_11905 [Pseudonocardiaceae bacterium]
MDDRRRRDPAHRGAIGTTGDLRGRFHGIQLWVNLPRASKWNPPRYQDIRGRQARLLFPPDGGALIRVIAGEVAGYTGPGSTFTR